MPANVLKKMIKKFKKMIYFEMKSGKGRNSVTPYSVKSIATTLEE